MQATSILCGLVSAHPSFLQSSKGFEPTLEDLKHFEEAKHSEDSSRPEEFKVIRRKANVAKLAKQTNVKDTNYKKIQEENT